MREEEEEEETKLQHDFSKSLHLFLIMSNVVLFPYTRGGQNRNSHVTGMFLALMKAAPHTFKQLTTN
jgi:hypothetical protein